MPFTKSDIIEVQIENIFTPENTQEILDEMTPYLSQAFPNLTDEQRAALYTALFALSSKTAYIAVNATLNTIAYYEE